MSKSRGNVVNPNDVVAQYGADTMRLYIMFIGDFEKAAAWSDNAVKGCKRFLDRVWNLSEQLTDSMAYTPANESAIHKAIKKVSRRHRGHEVQHRHRRPHGPGQRLLRQRLLQGGFCRPAAHALPLRSHMCEELWETLGFAASSGMICTQPWPAYDESKTISAEVTLAVQVGGKLKTTVTVPLDSDQDTVVSAALADPKVARIADGMELMKTILVPNKLVNLIFKPKK